MGWAALGGFEAVWSTNGGPYRSRMTTIATVLFGGALCGFIGSLVPHCAHRAGPARDVLITAAVCFVVIFARVASQPIASTAVIILVLYFAGYGNPSPRFRRLGKRSAYILGGLWSALLSLFLWPVDPFRPARLEVAACYDLLAKFTARLHATGDAPTHAPTHTAHDDDHTHAVGFKRKLRAKLESARAALASTAARAPARTIRARNSASCSKPPTCSSPRTVRLAELSEAMSAGVGPAALADIAAWSAAPSAPSHRPAHPPARRRRLLRPRRLPPPRTHHPPRRCPVRAASSQPDPLLPHLLADERDALQNMEIAFEAVRAVWTGVQTLPGSPSPIQPGAPSMQSHRMGGTYKARTDSPTPPPGSTPSAKTGPSTRS